MFNVYRLISKILSTRERFICFFILVLASVSSLLEVVAVVSLGAIISLSLGGEATVSVLDYFGFAFELDHNLLGFVGVVIVSSAVLSTLAMVKLVRFSHFLGAKVSNLLAEKFLRLPLEFHIKSNSSELINASAVDIQRLTNQGLVPALLIMPRLLVLVMLIVSLFSANANATIFMGVFFASTYFLMIFKFKNLNRDYGHKLTVTSEERIRTLREALVSIKENFVYDSRHLFVNKFKRNSLDFANIYSNIQLVSILPRYFLEGIVFGLLITLIWSTLYFDNIFDFDVGLLAVFGVAAVKLLPAFQAVFSYISGFQTVAPVVHQTLHILSLAEWRVKNNPSSGFKDFKVLEANSMSLCISSDPEVVIGPVDMHVYAGQTVGIIGVSGGGKSSLVDGLVGLHPIISGELLINGIKTSGLIQANVKVGYVGQVVPILNDTLRENIVFGSKKDFTEKEILNVLEMSGLKNFVENLIHGIDTEIGEDGASISGGQRQRVGIARALMNDADVLIFDEATSALDGQTEEEFIQNLNENYPMKTKIVISHRLAALRYADVIYRVNAGKMSKSFTFEDGIGIDGLSKGTI